MKVLVACEFSGIVRDAFIEAGHDAVSCDLLPTERPGPHIQGDVGPLLRETWDLVIAHPPCRYLVHSRGRLRDIPETLDGIEFFQECQAANASMVAVENPSQYKWVREFTGEPSFFVQPHHFGDTYLKKTYFWTKGLPILLPTSYIAEDGALFQSWVGGGNPLARKGRRHRSPKERATFFPSMARAMAHQWGSL